MMRKFLPAALAATALLFFPAGRALAESGHGGSSSHGGSSHGSGSHSGSSHGGGSHSGGSHGGSHGGGSHGGWSHGGHGGHDGGGHHHGGGHHGGGWIYYPWPYWYGGWGWDCPVDSDCYGYGPGYGPGYGAGYGPEYAPVPEGDAEEWGIVDIEISPDLMRVYLDGRYIGLANDFDGDPDYLHLRPGSYKLEFRLEGYESWSLAVNVDSGAKIEVNKKLHRLAGAPPPRVSNAPPPEGGVQHFFGKRGGKLEPEDADRSETQNEEDSADDATDSDEDAEEAPSQPTRLELSIQPPDAVVYLDGHFLGTAAEVSHSNRGVPLTPGKHEVSVLRPGSKDRAEEIDVAQGETKKLEISLK